MTDESTAMTTQIQSPGPKLEKEVPMLLFNPPRPCTPSHNSLLKTCRSGLKTARNELKTQQKSRNHHLVRPQSATKSLKSKLRVYKRVIGPNTERDVTFYTQYAP